MKIYTKTGDKGKTSLLGGTRVSKAHERIEAYGTVDELNSAIGVLRSTPSDHNEFLLEIQHILFNIGSILATEREVKFELKQVEPSDVEKLEKEMDRLNESLPPLKEFVLPGGSLANGHAHMCRSICRRAERRVVQLEDVPELLVKYLNRLSDYFFMLSRALLHEAGREEIKWRS